MMGGSETIGGEKTAGGGGGRPITGGVKLLKGFGVPEEKMDGNTPWGMVGGGAAGGAVEGAGGAGCAPPTKPVNRPRAGEAKLEALIAIGMTLSP
jgi:hypothetical protein